MMLNSAFKKKQSYGIVIKGIIAIDRVSAVRTHAKREMIALNESGSLPQEFCKTNASRRAAEFGTVIKFERAVKEQ